MSTELILIRYGNAVRVNEDYFHAPLTSLGQEQATQTGQYFSAPENHLDGFYSSPLRRTQETAKIIGGSPHPQLLKSPRKPIQLRKHSHQKQIKNNAPIFLA